MEIISTTNVRKTIAEERAEKFLERCKTGKPRLQPKQKLQQRLRQSITDLIRGHKCRRETERVCSGHHYLYIALRVCYENNMEYGSISDLILEIFLCEHSLQAIFCVLLPSQMIKNNVNTNIPTIYPGFSPKSLNIPILEAFAFYLRNITEVNSCSVASLTKLRLVNFEFDTHKELTPILAAAKRRDPYLVQLLLRYGADPIQTSIACPETDAIDIIVSGLNGICSFKNSSFGSHAKSTMKEEETKGKLCLRYISRCVRTINFSRSSYFETQPKDDEADQQKVYNLQGDLASSLDMSTYSGVRSLQHLCRLTVRKQILDNSPRCLPVSIQLLPLTGVMKRYLDLQFD